jgi:hypothetical protein
MTAPEITAAQVGCWVDQSHGDAETLNRRVIDTATAYGWQLADTDAAYLTEVLNPRADLRELSKRAAELAEIVSAIADDAVDYLNGITPDGLYFEIDDNSLYLRDDSEEI